MRCRLLQEDAGPLAAARRLRDAARPELISVLPPQGRHLTVNMALQCYQEAFWAAPSTAVAFERVSYPRAQQSVP